MTPEERRLQQETRRHFFGRMGVGIGQVALADLLAGGKLFGAETKNANPMAPRPPHFAPKVKSVIFLHMAGGPSQLDLFDYKPKLNEYDSKPIPQSFIEGKRFAFMDTVSAVPMTVLGTKREFKQHGKSGMWLSNLLPNLATVADDITLVNGISTDNFNHGPAKFFMSTGSTRPGRPSMGSWVTYGIGSESQDLPGFVVLLSGPRGPRGGAGCRLSGFIPH